MIRTSNFNGRLTIPRDFLDLVKMEASRLLICKNDNVDGYFLRELTEENIKNTKIAGLVVMDDKGRIPLESLLKDAKNKEFEIFIYNGDIYFAPKKDSSD